MQLFPKMTVFKTLVQFVRQTSLGLLQRIIQSLSPHSPSDGKIEKNRVVAPFCGSRHQSGTSVTTKTFNKGFTRRVDHDCVAGDDWRERYVQLLLRRLYRNELRRAIAVLDANALSLVEHYVWSHAAGTPNAAADIRTELEVAVNITGVCSNRLIVGEGAWDIRASAYDTKITPGRIVPPPSV
jgi:hypothetical protein